MRRRRFKSGNYGVTIGNTLGDRNGRYVSKMCSLYMIRHIQRYSMTDKETMEFLCWILGNDMEVIGKFLLEQLNEMQRPKYEEELTESNLDPDDYADVAFRVLRKIGARALKRIQKFAVGLLEQRADSFKGKRLSDIEKNVKLIKTMFGLSDNEVRFCEFLFLLSTHDEIDNFFRSHLNCQNFSGQKYLTNVLQITKMELDTITTGTLKKIDMYEMDVHNLELKEEYITLFQNPSNPNIIQNFYTKAPKTIVDLSHHFINKDEKQLIFKLLRKKPATSNHLLFYGLHGTGKSTFAQGICQQLGLPAYEIVRGEENTTKQRRAAIISCINMTNSGDGAVIIVDEADNILNTQDSWFFRGETQDKGWLNKLLEEKGLRMIWITNNISEIEASVMRRFSFSLNFKSFNRVQRIQLWNNVVENNKCKRFFNRSDIEQFAKGYKVSAGAIDLAVKKAIETESKSKKEFQKTVSLTLVSHRILLNYGEKPVDKEGVENNYSIDGLNIRGNLVEMLKQLKRFNIFLNKSSEAKIMNMNLLFHGVPGTGKSELARYIADYLDREIICKRVSDLQSMYVGEAEKNIKRAFEEAESEQAILIIDEADSLLFDRNNAVRSWEVSFTNEFLTRMERFRGILICTTNRINSLDEASLRRFNHKIEFKYLNAEGNVIFYRKLLKPLLAEPLTGVSGISQ